MRGSGYQGLAYRCASLFDRRTKFTSFIVLASLLSSFFFFLKSDTLAYDDAAKWFGSGGVPLRQVPTLVLPLCLDTKTGLVVNHGRSTSGRYSLT